jgi:hypothetical protein
LAFLFFFGRGQDDFTNAPNGPTFLFIPRGQLCVECSHYGRCEWCASTPAYDGYESLSDLVGYLDGNKAPDHYAREEGRLDEGCIHGGKDDGA